MSEYQRYEFMTVDRPLTPQELDEVNDLSSHIEASSTHAFIEYNWGDFKHDPIQVLHDYFDGFLYWANWGAPQLAFRFPHGILPGDLLDGYDLEDFATFTQHVKYDILDIQFGEMESPDEWTEYELGSLIAIRDELMEGDLRALYIVWLAAQGAPGYYDDEEDDEDEDYSKDEDEISTPPVPTGFGTLTAAQQALAELLQVPQELLTAAAQHSQTAAPASSDDVAAWVKLLPPERRDEYLVRLARNEPGLSRLLLKELRELGRDETRQETPEGERVTSATLFAESSAVKARLEREKREQEHAAHLRRLQEIHDHQDTYWRQAEQAAARGTGPGYDEAERILANLHEAAAHYNETQAFYDRLRAWIQPHLRRPALLKRLQAHQFPLPEM